MAKNRPPGYPGNHRPPVGPTRRPPSGGDDPDGLWNIIRLSRVLGVPIQTIYGWQKIAYGPQAIKIGKHLRWFPTDVIAWLIQLRDDRARQSPDSQRPSVGGGRLSVVEVAHILHVEPANVLNLLNAGLLPRPASEHPQILWDRESFINWHNQPGL